MKKIPRISEAEWVVMKVLWAREAATANEVIDDLRIATDWAPKTIRTLISRLVQKEALRIEKGGKEYVYAPAVGERDCARAESQSFLSRVYGGALKPMLASFLEQESLSAEEIEELRQLLDSREKQSAARSARDTTTANKGGRR